MGELFIELALADTPALGLKDGGIIRPIYNTPRGKLSPADGLIVRCHCSDAELLDNLTYIFQRVFQ